MLEKRFGERVKTARLAQQMTMAELAATCGLSKGFISQLESGASNPSLNTLRKIGDALKIPVTDLLGAQDPCGSIDLVATEMLRPTVLHEPYGLAKGPGISVLSSAPDGIHSLVTIPQGSRLFYIGNVLENEAHGTALVIVLAGSISLLQDQDDLELSRGAVASWDAGSSYTIEATGLTDASLVLYIPQECTMPTYQEDRDATRTRTLRHAAAPVPVRSAVMPNRRRGMPARIQSTRSGAGPTRTAEGPLRLVAMRAQRLAERRGQS